MKNLENIKDWKELKNQVVCGDCLEGMKLMPDKSIDLILTDPPYGVTQNKWDIVPNFSNLWKQLLRIGKDNAAYILTATQPFATDLINSNRESFRYDLIWYKALGTGHLNCNRMPMRNHEHILVFYKKLPTYNPQKSIGVMRRKGSDNDDTTTNYGKFKGVVSVNNTYHPQSVIDLTNGDRTKENQHPTQKPLSLFEYLLKTYSNKGDLICDPFMGSWTTARACKDLGRDFIGFELSEEYCKVGEKRLQQEVMF